MKVDGKNYSYLDENGQVAGEAILFMKSQPLNPDGTIGYMVEPGTTEWLAWEAYFEQTDHDEFGLIVDRFPKQLAMFRMHGHQRKKYMVPAALPWIFDKTFSPASVKPKPKPRMSKDMTPAQIEAMMAAIRKRHSDPKFLRDEAKRTWVAAMRRLAPTPHAEAFYIEFLKGRPDLVEIATEIELMPKGKPGLPNGGYGLGWGEIRKTVESAYWASMEQKEAAE